MFTTRLRQRADGTWEITAKWSNREGTLHNGGFLSRTDALYERARLYLEYGSPRQKENARKGLDRLDHEARLTQHRLLDA